MPFAQQWDEEGTFPLELYLTAGRAGVLGAGFEMSYSGSGGGIAETLCLKEELARFGSGGVRVGLTTHTIALPPLLAIGSAALKDRVVPPVLRGEKLMARAISEPLRAKPGDPRGAHLVSQKTIDAFFHKALLPAPDAGLGCAGPTHDLVGADAVGA